MQPLTFTVRGEPKAQPRVKAMRMGGFIKIYTPGTAKVWKGLVAKAAAPFLSPEPFSGPLALTIDFYFARPKAHHNAKGELRPAAPTHHTKKPDADNLAKGVMDALTDAGLWEDDDQIVSLLARKHYATPENPEGARVILDFFQ
jgi:Holliday junction resolvase RusA-like endonuclease